MNKTKLMTTSVTIEAGDAQLGGSWSRQEGARGAVLFIHGSGSSRFSPRNQYVAENFQEAGLATLLFDLLTAAEEQEDRLTSRLRFDINLLTMRTQGAASWLTRQEFAHGLALGYFGASTGAAAALIAAAQRPELVRAVVSRGGRPDLADGFLERVQAPVLLIVEGKDAAVLQLNELAMGKLPAEIPRQLAVVPGANHLFEEPGTLEMAARLAADWFSTYLGKEVI